MACETASFQLFPSSQSLQDEHPFSSSSDFSRRLWVRGPHRTSSAQGAVSLALDRTSGHVFAVKSIREGAPPRELRALENEIHILGRLRGLDTVIPILGSDWSTEEDGVRIRNLWLEYPSGLTLSDVTRGFGGKLELSVVRAYTRGILQALCDIHERGIVHCDVKGQNVLLAPSGRVLLSSFSRSRVSSSPAFSRKSRSSFGGGAYCWMAPEVARQEEQGPPSDVWSLGCTVIEMMSGRPPWQHLVQHHASSPSSCAESGSPADEAGKSGADATSPSPPADFSAVIEAIAHSGEMPLFPPEISSEGHDFLVRCFRRDPHARSTAKDLLEHPFLKGLPAIGIVRRGACDDRHCPCACHGHDGSPPVAGASDLAADGAAAAAAASISAASKQPEGAAQKGPTPMHQRSLSTSPRPLPSPPSRVPVSQSPRSPRSKPPVAPGGTAGPTSSGTPPARAASRPSPPRAASAAFPAAMQPPSRTEGVSARLSPEWVSSMSSPVMGRSSSFHATPGREGPAAARLNHYHKSSLYHTSADRYAPDEPAQPEFRRNRSLSPLRLSGGVSMAGGPLISQFLQHLEPLNLPQTPGWRGPGAGGGAASAAAAGFVGDATTPHAKAAFSKALSRLLSIDDGEGGLSPKDYNRELSLGYMIKQESMRMQAAEAAYTRAGLAGHHKGIVGGLLEEEDEAESVPMERKRSPRGAYSNKPTLEESGEGTPKAQRHLSEPLRPIRGRLPTPFQPSVSWGDTTTPTHSANFHSAPNDGARGGRSPLRDQEGRWSSVGGDRQRGLLEGRSVVTQQPLAGGEKEVEVGRQGLQERTSRAHAKAVGLHSVSEGSRSRSPLPSKGGEGHAVPVSPRSWSFSGRVSTPYHPQGEQQQQSQHLRTVSTSSVSSSSSSAASQKDQENEDASRRTPPRGSSRSVRGRLSTPFVPNPVEGGGADGHQRRLSPKDSQGQEEEEEEYESEGKKWVVGGPSRPVRGRLHTPFHQEGEVPEPQQLPPHLSATPRALTSPRRHPGVPGADDWMPSASNQNAVHWGAQEVQPEYCPSSHRRRCSAEDATARRSPNGPGGPSPLSSPPSAAPTLSHKDARRDIVTSSARPSPQHGTMERAPAGSSASPLTHTIFPGKAKAISGAAAAAAVNSTLEVTGRSVTLQQGLGVAERGQVATLPQKAAARNAAAKWRAAAAAAQAGNRSSGTARAAEVSINVLQQQAERPAHPSRQQGSSGKGGAVNGSSGNKNSSSISISKGGSSVSDDCMGHVARSPTDVPHTVGQSLDSGRRNNKGMGMTHNGFARVRSASQG